ALDLERVLADQVAGQLLDALGDRLLLALEGRLAPAVEPRVGVDPDEGPVGAPAPAEVRLDASDSHRLLRANVAAVYSASAGEFGREGRGVAAYEAGRGRDRGLGRIRPGRSRPVADELSGADPPLARSGRSALRPVEARAAGVRPGRDPDRGRAGRPAAADRRRDRGP